MLLATLLQAAAPVAAPPQQPSTEKPIVVIGRRLSVTEQALKDCLARRCPPKEEIAAALAHGENQFMAGAYRDARTTLAGSVRRNRRHARELPVEVANVIRAQARVAAHLGLADSQRAGTLDAYQALKAGLPADHPDLLIQQLEVGDVLVGSKRRLEDVNVHAYNSVRRRARASGQPLIEGHALLRAAVLYVALSDMDRAAYLGRARAALREIAATTGPELQPFRDAGLLLAARMAERDGDKQAIDRALATVRERLGSKPILLYAPSFQPDNNGRGLTTGSVTTRVNVDSVDGQWVDVSFWIRPDGTVADPEMVRGSPTLQDYWVAPVLKAIAGRRYTPFPGAKGDPGRLHFERYTRTARLVAATGSMLRQREPFSRIEMLDLTVDTPGGEPAS